LSVTLYSYYRSSASYRVRIALNLKQVDYTINPVHLLTNGGEQFRPEFLEKNPQGLLPALEIGDIVLTQSSAIIEYLEQAYPHPHLLPSDLIDQCQVRALAQLISCDIHPLNNLRVLKYLRFEGLSEQQKEEWYRHWIFQGFRAFEALLTRYQSSAQVCFGDTPGLADVFLIPQVYNAQRYHLDIESFPRLLAVYNHCCTLVPFIEAAPENQVDAEG